MLAEIVKVRRSDDAELLRRWSVVLDLPAQIRAEVAMLRVPGGLTDELPSIEAALSKAALNTQVKGWVRSLTGEALKELDICSQQLHGYRPQQTIDESELGKMRDRIMSLMAEVESADDLSDELRSTLSEHLQDMLRAVDLHDVAGTRELKRTLERAVGSFSINPKLWIEALNKPAFNGFVNLLAVITFMLQLPVNIEALMSRSPAEISEPATEQPALPSGSRSGEHEGDDSEIVEGEVLEGDTAPDNRD